MGDTKIEWADVTWNPVTGCQKVSAGCKHCYAETFANRRMGAFAGMVGWPLVATLDGERPRRFTDVMCHPERLDAPLHWRKPRRVFVNSMSDLFHEAVPDDFIARVFAAMASASQHQFLVLTKRPERMLAIVSAMGECEHGWITHDGTNPRSFDGTGIVIPAPTTGGGRRLTGERGPDGRRAAIPIVNAWPLPNVWLGVSVEDQPTFDERWPWLRGTPAAVRFLSYEPALAGVDLSEALLCSDCGEPGCSGDVYADWVIVGGESGHGARPFDVQWARDTIAQCRAAGVPVFVKQLGARPVYQLSASGPERDIPGKRHLWDSPHGYTLGLRNRKGDDPGEWPKDLRVREFPVAGAVAA